MAGAHIHILDATLDHAGRTPGCSLNLDEKMRIAHQLARLGADVIEAGSPMSSPADFEAVRLIARSIDRATVSARCRARTSDIDRAWEAIQGARMPRLHLYAECSDTLLGSVPRTDHLAAIRSAVEYAVTVCSDVEFSCEDATRADGQYLLLVVATAALAGASVVSLCDSAGCAIPAEYGEMFRRVREHLGGESRVRLGAACANDLGMALASTVEAIRNGAQQAECSVNGIGARSGVTALEELIVLLEARREALGWTTRVCADEIYTTSRLLSSLTGMPVQKNKPVVGANAFSGTSRRSGEGGAVHAVDYAVVAPRFIGIRHTPSVLGKHSDAAALAQRYMELGHEISGERLDHAFSLFRQAAEQKREVMDDDLLAILELNSQDPDEIYHLENIQVHSGTTLRPTATVELRRGTERFVDSATGDGPVDAAYKAIERITGLAGQLTEYLIKSVSLGRDGFGEVFVRAEFDGVSFHGRGVSTDIITGSAKAYLEAVNRAAVAKKKRGVGIPAQVRQE